MRICYKIHIFGFMAQHLCVSGSSARSMSLDSCLSIHVYLRVLCKIHVAGSVYQHPYVSQDLRILYKIHVFRFMSQHLCISRMLCKIHVNVSGFMSQHLYISGSSARSMSPDPCLRFRSQHPCVYQEHSGTSARSMSPDPYISIHKYLRILCKIHVSDSCLSIFIPQGPLKDLRLRIHVSASTCISGTSARSTSPDPYVSMHMYLKLLCKIHVSGSVYQHPYVSQDLRILYKIHVFRFMSQHLCISRMLCKIHVNVSGFMSQHLYISGSSARSMSPDPCLRFRSQHPCVYQEHSGTSARSMSPDPYISIHKYLRILCKIHVSDSCLSIFIPQGPLQDPCLRIHVSTSICILQDPCLRIRK